MRKDTPVVFITGSLRKGTVSIPMAQALYGPIIRGIFWTVRSSIRGRKWNLPCLVSYKVGRSESHYCPKVDLANCLSLLTWHMEVAPLHLPFPETVSSFLT